MNKPPPLAPKPGQVLVFKAIYKFTGRQPDELTFDEGDTLYVLDRISDPNWWKAKCGDKIGLVPSNYLEQNALLQEAPLHEAAKRGNSSFLAQSLNNRVSINGLDNAGNTALHWASRGGHIECLRLLLEQPNVQIDVQNKLGDTSLHGAAWKSQKDSIKLLLLHGASLIVKNHAGQMPFELAKDPEIAAMIKPAIRTSVNYDDTEYIDDEEEE